MPLASASPMEKTNVSTETEAPQVLVNSQGLTITLQSPPTETNFLAYNRHCAALDSDYLMQPINEAEYDSETQACVDRNTGGPSSFYDHYTTKPRKKKGRAVGCECPLTYTGSLSGASASNPEDFLQAPAEKEVPLHAAGKGAFSDPVTRRLATGRLPPPDAS